LSFGLLVFVDGFTLIIVYARGKTQSELSFAPIAQLRLLIIAQLGAAVDAGEKQWLP